ncbi:hypothetical protein niasHT_005603 [Heterodera trifolii]|uniref:Uncharacterized protein n=1 Tax=Heterodera trifolii TaxID=157864 RepID=A0ABD2M3Q4_9BILA
MKHLNAQHVLLQFFFIFTLQISWNFGTESAADEPLITYTDDDGNKLQMKLPDLLHKWHVEHCATKNYKKQECTRKEKEESFSCKWEDGKCVPDSGRKPPKMALPELVRKRLSSLLKKDGNKIMPASPSSKDGKSLVGTQELPKIALLRSLSKRRSNSVRRESEKSPFASPRSQKTTLARSLSRTIFGIRR